MKNIFIASLFIALGFSANAQIDSSKIFDEYPCLMPEFQYGSDSLLKYLAKNIRYPYGDLDVEGIVIIGFTVNEDGFMHDFEVLKPLYDLIDKEALRVARSTQGMWKPMVCNGKPLKSKYKLPIRFR